MPAQTGHHRKPLIFFIFLATLLWPVVMTLTALPAAAQDDCIDCHDQIGQVIDTSIYVHAPVQNKKCKICHAAAARQDTFRAEQTTAPRPPVARYQQEDASEPAGEPVQWLAENFTPSTFQCALLDTMDVKNTIVLDVWGAGSARQSREFSSPAIATLPERDPAKEGLSIDNLHLGREQHQSPLSLHWRTNNPCRCIIHYGSESPTTAVEEDDLYLRDHSLDLHTLSPQGYVTEIQCRDPFNRIRFTDQFNIQQLAVHDKTPVPAALDADPGVHFFRIKNKLWIEVVSAQPVSVSIGTRHHAKTLPAAQPLYSPPSAPAPPSAEAVADVDPSLSPRHEEHIVLNSRHYTSTEVCYSCHSGLEAGTSHPVDVLPSPGMVIPPEYPRLADGRISCMSCHTVHGGNEEFRLLKKSKKQLCIGCHKNY